jgi:tetratricopeptide (TPR) repeat protein
MRNSKLDRPDPMPLTTDRAEERTTSLGERLLVLRRIAHPSDRGPCGWPARLLWIWVSLAVAAVVVSALWIAGRLPWSDASTSHPGRSRCADAFAAERWLEASTTCAQEADRTSDSGAGVRAASALFHLGHHDEALTSAQRWFGSNDDATARQIVGEIYDDRDDPVRAIALLEVALAEHLGRTDPDHVEAARDAGYLALAYMHAGLLGDAVHAAETAVRESDLTSQDDANTLLRGRARLKLGKIMTEIGDFASARTMLWGAQQTLARWPTDQAWVFLQLGMLDQAAGDPASAASLFERALELASQAGVAPVVTSARLNLAYSWCEVGRPEKAELEMAKVDDQTRNHPTALLVAGMIAADRGQRERADQLFARAADGVPTDDYKMDVALRRGRLAERFSDLAAAEQRYREAIDLVEKLRKNTDSLGLRPLVLARRREPYRRLLSLLLQQGRRVDALVTTEQLHARTWLDALVGHAGPSTGRTPAASAASLGRRLHIDAAGPPSPDELLTLLRKHEILIFFETESELWRFHLLDGAITGLDPVPDNARSLFERWRKAPDDQTLAAQLGDLLIPPAARAPSPRPLYIVADEALGTLPFAALRVNGRFLVEDRATARLPGIVALRCRGHVTPQRPGVFLGDSRDDLAFARQETLALARSLGGDAFVGREATVERLEASRNATLLHLAVHANVDPAGARLLFANAQQVTAADIVEHAIGPRVAVLAGCATAVGRDPEGWGALSSAFLAAGSRSVVGTLRPVADSDAREIMERFYQHDGARQPGLALAAAQRELLATHPPSVWGPFVVYGSADVADCQSPP